MGGISVKELPSAATILAAYDFDPLIGLLHKRLPLIKGFGRKARDSQSYNRNTAGKRAGSQSPNGYRLMRVDGEFFAEHRLVLKIVHGTDPVGWVDHINGVRDDNRIGNLRDVTPSENALNAIRDRWAAELRWRPAALAMDRLRDRALQEDRRRARFSVLKREYEPLGAGWSASL